MEAKLEELKGKILLSIKVNEDNDEIIFRTVCGEVFKMYHESDCCESVSINDINGDLQDLVGSEILIAEEVNSEEFEKQYIESFKLEDGKEDYDWNYKDQDGNSKPESFTWTFYKFATIKGYVDIRWHGESNGYYSEGVDFVKQDENGKFNRWD